MMKPLKMRKRVGKGVRNRKKRAQKDAVLLAETKVRAASIDHFLDMIPCIYYLGTDNPEYLANKPGLSPLRVKSTSQLAMASAETEDDRVEAQLTEITGDKSKAKKKKPTGKNAKKKKMTRGEGEPVIEPKNRKELVEKLHKAIAALKETRSKKQSEKDKVGAADQSARAKERALARNAELKASAGLEAKAAPKPESAAAKPAATPQATPATPQAEIGRFNFEPKTVTLPFGATKAKGTKKERLEKDVRIAEKEQRKVERAERDGRGDEVRKESAIAKSLKRARGEEVHDDVNKLRKAQMRMDKQKKKSAEKWDERKEDLRKKGVEKQAKRKETLGGLRTKKQKSQHERKEVERENERENELNMKPTPKT